MGACSCCDKPSPVSAAPKTNSQRLFEAPTPQVRKSTGIPSVDDFLEQYDGDLELRRCEPKDILGQSDRIHVVRSFASQQMFECHTFPRERLLLTDPQDFEDYIDKLKGFEHPHICQCMDAFVSDDKVVILYDNAGHHNQKLIKHIPHMKHFGEREVSDCVRQLAMALAAGNEVASDTAI